MARGAHTGKLRAGARVDHAAAIAAVHRAPALAGLPAVPTAAGRGRATIAARPLRELLRALHDHAVARVALRPRRRADSAAAARLRRGPAAGGRAALPHQSRVRETPPPAGQLELGAGVCRGVSRVGDAGQDSGAVGWWRVAEVAPAERLGRLSWIRADVQFGAWDICRPALEVVGNSVARGADGAFSCGTAFGTVFGTAAECLKVGV